MLADKMEEAMRKALGTLPEFRAASEWQWMAALQEAAQSLERHAADRLSELEGEAEKD